ARRRPVRPRRAVGRAGRAGGVAMRLRTLIDLGRAPAALWVPGGGVPGPGGGGVPTARTAGLACSSVCLYWAGMAANDWADRELDAVERPDRPIPSGRNPAPAALRAPA